MKIVVTAGATREPIDAVRFISNVSTGSTGAQLAELLSGFGHEVCLLRGEGAAVATGIHDQASFSSAAELTTLLQHRLATGSVDAVIMAAAVADYRAEQTAPGKIDSDHAEVLLRLIRNPKILPQLKAFAPRPIRVVGFKLTATPDLHARRNAVEKQFTSGAVDAVVHNDLTEIGAVPRHAHPFAFFATSGTEPQQLAGVPALAAQLNAWLNRSAASGA